MVYGRDEFNVYRIIDTVYLHRWVLEENSNNVVDHINNNGLDNRKCNLRVVEHANNIKNRKSKNTNNKSGYRNVQWDKKRNKWSVILSVDSKARWLGSFDDITEAGTYAEEMRQKYYGEFAGNN